MDLVKVIREIQRKKAERTRTETQAFCVSCKKRTALLTVEAAIRVHRFSLDEMPGFIAAGVLHRVHNSRGEVLFCQNSVRLIESDLRATQPLRPEFLPGMKTAA